MAGVELAFEISKDAMKLVKAGKAVVSSGGVRMLDGSLFELAKPIAQAASSSNPMNPLSFASSLGNNVQSVFIQKGVNKANKGIKDLKKQGVEIIKDIDRVHADTIEIKQGMIAVMDELHGANRALDVLNTKADVTLLKMNQLQYMVNNLTAVTWLNCGIGLLNCGISVVGFTQVLNRLSEISGQIAELEQVIGRNLVNDYRQKFEFYFNQIRTDVQFLQNPELKASEMHLIPEHLNGIQPFLQRIYNEYIDDKINGELACSIIFGLTDAFAQEIQLYSTRYLYENGTLPAAYDSWIKAITNLTQKEFLSRLETDLTLGHMELTLQQQKDVLDAVVVNSRLQLDNLVFSNLLTDAIPEMDYLNFDQYIADRAASEENIIETENGVLLMIA